MGGGSPSEPGTREQWPEDAGEGGCGWQMQGVKFLEADTRNRNFFVPVLVESAGLLPTTRPQANPIALHTADEKSGCDTEALVPAGSSDISPRRARSGSSTSQESEPINLADVDRLD